MTTLYKSPSHTDGCSQSQSSLHCLVEASNGVVSSASISNGSYPRWLQLFNCSSQAELPFNCHTNSQCTINSLYSLGTDCIETTSPNSFSIVASCSYQHGLHGEHRFPVTLLLWVMMLLPSNGHVCRAAS
jgi:hypothetical protein